jgi:hypothetical protein
MKAFAVLVLPRSTPDVTVARSRKRFNAMTKKRRRQVQTGPVFSIVVNFVPGRWTAGYTVAKSHAIPRVQTLRTVPDPWTLSPIALAGRLLWLNLRMSLEKHVPTRSQAVRNRVERGCRAATTARKPVTLGNAVPATSRSRSRADAAATPLMSSATRPHRNHLSARVCARLR